MSATPERIAEAKDVLLRYGLAMASPAAEVPGGTLNDNYRVATDAGPRFLRRYRDDLPTERIAGEHALMEWVAAREIPVPLPIRTGQGDTMVEHNRGRWALFPWAAGEPVERGRLTGEQASAMGEMLGRTHMVLSVHPLSRGAAMSMRWHKQQALDVLHAVAQAAVRERAQQWLVHAVTRQTAMLEALDPLPMESFASLPTQLLHGDFHDQQLLWDGNRVTAVTDWEIWHTDPRVFEVVRSLSFSRLLETELLDDYLHGYRRYGKLSEDECRLGLRLWWQSRIIGVWVWMAYFLQGNRELGQFLPYTARELERLGHSDWREAIEERFVRAVCG